MILSGLDTR